MDFLPAEVMRQTGSLAHWEHMLAPKETSSVLPSCLQVGTDPPQSLLDEHDDTERVGAPHWHFSCIVLQP